ncbi:MAG TPA: TAXI family TRAP transporter solute-binding subunit [Sphingobium sp.]
MKETYRLSGHFGAWDAAELAIEKALVAAGIGCDFTPGGDALAHMQALNAIEIQADTAQAGTERFDEAGMLYVDDGRADIGVNFFEQVDWAYRGFGHHEGQPHTNLRGIVTLVQPQYVCFAATKESGITSFDELVHNPRPVRLLTVSKSRTQTRFMGIVHGRVLEECGFTQEIVVEHGGEILTAVDGLDAILEDRVDMVGIPAYPGWGPTWGWSQMWAYLQVRNDLTFLPIPEAVRVKLCAELNITKGQLPRGMFRGLTQDTPTFAMHNHTVIVNAQLGDDEVYELTRALHDHREVFENAPVPFFYNPETGLKDLGAPIHPGARRFYTERGYLSR